MIGFVGAMASSLAIFVVFLTIILVQSVNMVLDNRAVIFKYSGSQSLPSGKKLRITIDATKSFIITGSDIRELLSSQKENLTSNFGLYCDYGSNLNYESSERISVFNYVRLQQSGVNINLFPAINGNTKDNKCYIADVKDILQMYPEEIRKTLKYLTPAEMAANRKKAEPFQPIVPKTDN